MLLLNSYTSSFNSSYSKIEDYLLSGSGTLDASIFAKCFCDDAAVYGEEVEERFCFSIACT